MFTSMKEIDIKTINTFRNKSLYCSESVIKTMFFEIIVDDLPEVPRVTSARKTIKDISEEFADYVEMGPPPLCMIHSCPAEGLQAGCANCHLPSPEILARYLNVDSRFRLQFTLIIAISYNKEHIVRHILHEKQLDPNYQWDGRSPIYCAVILGHFDIMKLLLEAGAKVKRRNGRKGSIVRRIFSVHDATCNGNLRMLQLLVSCGADINAQDSHKHTPLYLATLYGHSHLIKWVLSAGALINMIQKNNLSVLHTASCRGHFDICQTLIQGGANLSLCDEYGYTALHTAVSYDFEDIVKLLLEAGADKDMRIMSTNETVLHIACINGSVNIIRLLLRAGVSIEGRDFEGYTPLLTAMKHKRIYSAFFLIKAGANVNAVTKQGISVVDLSLSNKYREMITTILIRSGAFVSKKRLCAC